MNISHLDKAEVLVALYNGSKQQGMGFMHLDGRQSMFFKEEAEELLKQTIYFDYLHGRVMKIDLSGDELATYLYNRDNGSGAVEKILASLKPTHEPK